MNRIYFLILLAIGSVFFSCKKGPDDPAISFRSRSARLAGTWKIVKGKESFSHINSPNTSTVSITDSNYQKTNSDGVTPSESGIISMEYTFTKDGDYSFARIETYGIKSDTVKGTGTWNFLNGNGDLKNKEAILLTQMTSSISYHGIANNDVFSKNNVGTIWKLTALRNDYLVIDSEAAHALPNDYSEALHYEFTK